VNKFATKVLLILNILSAAALLLSYLAPLVDPAKLGVPALFGLAYPYILLVNLIFTCFWLIRWRKEVFLSVAIILLGWNPLNNLIPIHLNKTKAPKTLVRRGRLRSFLTMSEALMYTGGPRIPGPSRRSSIF
jgi:hypothetical protein